MIKKLILLVLIVFLSACDFTDSEKIIDEEAYENIFLELAILDQYDEKLFNDTNREELKENIFGKHNVTEHQFEISHEYYQNQVEKQLERIERIAIKLRNERDKIGEADRTYRGANEEELDSLRQQFRNR